MEKYTLQGLLKQHLPGILSRLNFPLHQYKALKHLESCRTEALGGHAQYCENGHLNGVWYNSCKHRSCPQCRGMATEEWLVNTQRVLLDCPHHHVIFTFPSELNDLWRYNRGIMTDILFKATHQTLQGFAKDPKYLGAVPGMLTVLHTWGRSLPLHPHTHVLISHGGLNKNGEWVEPKKKILFPQKPVMMVFRGKLLAMVKKALKDEDWVFPPNDQEQQVVNLLNKLGRKQWMVHFCDRYEHADGVAKYLSRYVKSGPLKNSQIREVTKTHVSFRYKSHETKRVETLKLSIEDFVTRWVQHVPLAGKRSVRYLGLYNSAARERLNAARVALGQQPVSEKALLRWKDFLEEKGSMPECKFCGKALNVEKEVAPVRPLRKSA